MKKLLFTALLSLLVLGVSAQKKTLKSAQKAYNKKTYDLAIQLATEASNNPETQDNSDVFVILGKASLYKYQADKTDIKLAQESYDYFQTAIEKGGNKVKSKMMEEVVLNPADGTRFSGGDALRHLEIHMIKQANAYFEEGEYANAHELFSIASKIIDDVGYDFYAGYTAQSADLGEKSVSHYERVITFNAEEEYPQAKYAYIGLIDHYSYIEDWDNALKYINEGLALFPDEDMFEDYQTDVLIKADKIDDAINSLKAQIAQDGSNANQHYGLAFLYWNADRQEEAKDAAEKAVELNPQLHDALYIIGSVYFNEAATLSTEANNETDNDKYKVKKDRANELFEKAMPYFEKAHAIETTELSYLSPLSTIYDQLEMDDKRDEALKKMEVIEGGN